MEKRVWIGAFSEINLKSKIQNLKLVLMGAWLFALSSSLDAQQPGKIFRIGFLDSSTASGMAVMVDAFRQGLRDLGYIEGKNILVEYRFAESQGDKRVKELAADLVRL